MEVVGFRVKKNKKVKEYNVDIDKELAKLAMYVLLSNHLTGSAYATASVSVALKPLLKTLQDLAEPVAYGFMIKGFMQVMSGNEHDGFKTIKHSIGGFVGIQWIPYIFSIIKGIKLG